GIARTRALPRVGAAVRQDAPGAVRGRVGRGVRRGHQGRSRLSRLVLLPRRRARCAEPVPGIPDRSAALPAEGAERSMGAERGHGARAGHESAREPVGYGADHHAEVTRAGARMSQPPVNEIDPSKLYRATITTDRGTIVMDLDPKLAPVTVNNFVALARQ